MPRRSVRCSGNRWPNATSSWAWAIARRWNGTWTGATTSPRWAAPSASATWSTRSAAPVALLGPDAHEGEHSIEFPLLFLQAVHQLHPSPREVRFIPLLCGGLHGFVEGYQKWDDLEEFHALAAALRKVFATHPPGEKLRIIVSIDGCHLGPRFQHPFQVTPELLKATEAWENELWAMAAAGDARLFLDWFRAQGNDRYFDGVGALALLMAARAISASSARIMSSGSPRAMRAR